MENLATVVNHERKVSTSVIKHTENDNSNAEETESSESSRKSKFDSSSHEGKNYPEQRLSLQASPLGSLVAEDLEERKPSLSIGVLDKQLPGDPEKQLASKPSIVTHTPSRQGLSDDPQNAAPTKTLPNSKIRSSADILEPSTESESNPEVFDGKIPDELTVVSAKSQKAEISPSQSANQVSIKGQNQSKNSLPRSVNYTPSRYKPKVDSWHVQCKLNHRHIKENVLIKQKIFESREMVPVPEEASSKRCQRSAASKMARTETALRPKIPIQILQPLKHKGPVQVFQPSQRNENKSQSTVSQTPRKHSSSKSVTVVHSDDVSIKTEDITFEIADENAANSASKYSNKEPNKISFAPNPDVSFNKDLLLPESKTRLGSRGVVITNKSFKNTEWSTHFENMAVEKCVYFISADNLKYSQETLKCLKFSHLTSYQNVEAILRCCSSLTKLSFSNITIVQKKLFKPDDQEYVQIQLPKLKSLEIVQWNRRITKYEYWLLNFFNRGIICKSLASFTLQGADYLPDKESLKSKLQNLVEPSAVLYFLLKHRQSLRRLSIGGVGFQLIAPGVPKPLQELNRLQMASIRATMNIEHLDTLLNSQQKIQNLVLTGFIERFEPDLGATVHRCIKRNHESLVSLTLSPCVVADEIFKIHYGKIYSFDCEIFQDCKHLKNLSINITISSQISSPKNSCGKIINIHLLPLTLVTLELYHEGFLTEELTAFAANFPKYVNLSNLVLSTSKTHPYYIYLSWVKSLVKLKNLRKADFYSGKLHDFQGICQYMLSKPKGFITMTTLGDRVSFFRAWPESQQSTQKSNVLDSASTTSSLKKK